MYVVVAVLLMAGDQAPVIPSREVAGSVKLPPLQIGLTELNVGTLLGGITVTCNVLEIAHCPGAGVNVYVVVAVLLMAGDQVPVIPSREVAGKEKLFPEQIGPMALNVGNLLAGKILTCNVLVLAHCPASGVKV